MNTKYQINLPSPYNNRQEKLTSALNAAKLEAVVLNPGPSLIYLTGLHFHLSERPVALIFIPGKASLLVLPELELAKVKDLPFPLLAYPYGEDPQTWNRAFRQAAEAAHIDGKIVGIEPHRLRVLEFQYLMEAAPKAQFLCTEVSLAALRMFKDEGELAAMHQAAKIAQKALQATLPIVRIGLTEKELASELTLQLLRAGSDAEIPFTPIVSGGPNSANPHATPSNRELNHGDLLVIDWGASFQGYYSDITRTFAIGNIESEYDLIGQIVLQANAAARQAARPGITAGEVDQAARTVIDDSGYGAYFTHRTGHGLGMEGHEEPYIRAGNPITLMPGMTFTIEPGIYLTNRNGVRIEDDVVITEQGMQCLTDLPREVIRLI